MQSACKNLGCPSEHSDLSQFEIDDYTLISQGKQCVDMVPGHLFKKYFWLQNYFI